jgi:hypothetical protein
LGFIGKIPQLRGHKIFLSLKDYFLQVFLTTILVKGFLQRFVAWRGCELRNRLFSTKDKISCGTQT